MTIVAQFEHTDEGLAWIFDHPIVLLLIAFLLWRASLTLWPIKTCPRCEGSGVRPGLVGGRMCGRCGGGGVVARFGAKADD